MGDHVRYAVPHNEINALRARLLGGDAGMEPPQPQTPPLPGAYQHYIIEARGKS